MTSSFYIHIPFCRQKCLYCKFALTPRFDDAKKRRYLAHLEKEIGVYFSMREREKARTIYFWWGTPSLLSLDEVKKILSLFSHDEMTETTLECNPEDISESFLLWLREIGVNRISLGVQSLSPAVLHAVGRSDAREVYKALDILRQVQWKNLNIDMILGLPHEKSGAIFSAVKTLHTKYENISHTSIYMLEEGIYPKEWARVQIPEEHMQEEYRVIRSYFSEEKWHQYEISNWAKPWYECRHNQGYWDHTEIRGFWLASASYEAWVRTENASSFSGYYDGKIKYEERIDAEELIKERLIFGVRTFHLEPDLVPEDVGKSLIAQWLLERKSWWYTPTDRGILLENTLLLTLLEKREKKSWVYERNHIIPPFQMPT